MFHLSFRSMQQKISFYFLVCLATIAFVHSFNRSPPGERELRLDLFQNYDANTRPVKRYASAVPVKIALTPLAIKNFNEKEQVISLDSWIRIDWQDEYLTWDPKYYDNITELHVSPSDVWRPDIAVYGGSPDTSLFPVVQTKAILYNNGSILWVPPFTINSRCSKPFSAHQNATMTSVQCDIRFGSWTYSGYLLDLQLGTDEVDLKYYKDHHYDWKLAKLVSGREVKYYTCCPEPYPAVDYNITLRRSDHNLNNELIENGHVIGEVLK